MLPVSASNLRRFAVTFGNIAQRKFKCLQFRKNYILSNIAHPHRKGCIKNIYGCCAKVNVRSDFRIDFCFKDVYKRTDIVLGFLFFRINFLRIYVRSNVVQFFFNRFRELAADGKMCFYKRGFCFCTGTDGCFFRYILTKFFKYFFFRK